jgi:uncharacterized membrane protein YcjF (UPF0283 family)
MIEALLENRIQHDFEQLKNMEVDSESYKATVDELVKLLDRNIEIKKVNNDIQDKTESRKVETELKREEMETNKKDQWIKNGLTAAGIVLPLTVTIWGVFKTFEFEKEGVVTTIMGRSFINKLMPKK